MSELTKREQLAAMALQGLLAGVSWHSGRILDTQELASDAVAAADALIWELGATERDRAGT